MIYADSFGEETPEQRKLLDKAKKDREFFGDVICRKDNFVVDDNFDYVEDEE